MCVDVLLCKSFGRTGKPRLDDQLVELLQGDLVKAHQDRWITLEMWRSEEDMPVVGEKGLLRAEMLYSRSEYRPLGHVIAKSSNVCGAKRALPDEQLVPHAPRGMAVRGPLAGLWQRERDLTHVVPAGHALMLLRRLWLRAAEIGEGGRLVNASGDSSEREDPEALWAGFDFALGSRGNANGRVGLDVHELALDVDVR
jgi:hypothetical protein